MKKILLVSLIILSVAAGYPSYGAQTKDLLNLNQITDILTAQKIEHYVFTNGQGNKFLVVPKFGGRILAVSVGGENVFWTHPDILKGQGGQRTWISPEGGPKSLLRSQDWKTPRDISMIDPGNYIAKPYAENKILGISNGFQATSSDGQETFQFRLVRWFQHLDDPLKTDPTFKGVKYEFLGVKFSNNLYNESNSAIKPAIDFWNLLQVPPKGTAVIPVKKAERSAWRGGYLEPENEKHIKANEDSLSFFIPGSERYEAGIRLESLSQTGIISYLQTSWPSGPFLIIMKFPVFPNAPYVNKPRAEPQTQGDPIQVYSHSGQGPLAYGELSCHSSGIEFKGRGAAAFPIYFYIYKSSLPTLLEIGQKLVCPGFKKARFFP